MTVPDVGAFVSTGGAIVIALAALAVVFAIVFVLPADDLAALDEQRRWAELEGIDWSEPWPHERSVPSERSKW